MLQSVEHRQTKIKLYDKISSISLTIVDGSYDRRTFDESRLHDNRLQRLQKQASKDSTDGSICSISSDSSNA